MARELAGDARSKRLGVIFERVLLRVRADEGRALPIDLEALVVIGGPPSACALPRDVKPDAVPEFVYDDAGRVALPDEIAQVDAERVAAPEPRVVVAARGEDDVDAGGESRETPRAELHEGRVPDPPERDEVARHLRVTGDADLHAPYVGEAVRRYAVNVLAGLAAVAHVSETTMRDRVGGNGEGRYVPSVVARRRSRTYGDMAKLSSFYGIELAMRTRGEMERHYEPHFHAWYGGLVVPISIRTGEPIGRKRQVPYFPPRAKRLIKTWVRLHRVELMANWERMKRHERIVLISGLP